MLRAEQARLEARVERFGACHDALDVWRTLGADKPEAIPGMPDDTFASLADQLQESTHDAR